MNRKELAEALAKRTGKSNAKANHLIDNFIDIISETLKNGDSVSLVGFGTFSVKKRAARTGRNPNTGEAIKIQASKLPSFKAGTKLKAAINGTKK
jgi:DNA-binding protein HU-beta